MKQWADLNVLQDLRDLKDHKAPEDQRDLEDLEDQLVLQQKEPNYFKELLEQSEKLDLPGLQERLDLLD
ncbi:hypothetical protein [Paenibacillus lycopersici]|uniref:hypothetical protein n=1 Tax=Paenibacillus lycopersici TaxID=2704462 RepID=UPI001CDB97BB|nr:hypothetical protein [Paenibacillus lycopersici]